MASPALAVKLAQQISSSQPWLLEHLRYASRRRILTLAPEMDKVAARRIETLIIGYLPEALHEAARQAVLRRIQQYARQPRQLRLFEGFSAAYEWAQATPAAEQWLAETIEKLRLKGGKALDLVNRGASGLRDYAVHCAKINREIQDRYRNDPQKLKAWAYGTHQIGWTVPGETLEAVLGRLTDEVWWKRRLLKKVRRLQEYAAQLFGLVQRGRSEYVSEKTLEDHQSNLEAAERWIKDTRLWKYDPHQDVYIQLPMQDLVNARQKGWLAEQHARVNGVSRTAQALGLDPYLVTITLASRWHPASPKYEEHTTEEAARWQQKQWARLRAAAKEAGLQMLGVKVPEPHHDGCPHWHLVVWTDDYPRAEKLFAEYFLEADNSHEPGAAEHRVTWEKARSTEGAIGYALKYVLKYVNPQTGPVSRERLAVGSWRSLYHLRKLDWFACNVVQPKVSTWREARRVTNAPAGMQAAVDAAEAGDWHAFTQACQSNPLYVRTERVPTKYEGEYRDRTVGLRDALGNMVITKGEPWKLANKDELADAIRAHQQEALTTAAALFAAGGSLNNPLSNNNLTLNHIKPRGWSACRETGSYITPSTGWEEQDDWDVPDQDDWDVPWDTPEATQDEQDPPF
ncbi:replication endonuclease [Acidithiobacillus caldus]